MDFQHEVYRSIESKYHAAPKTCKYKWHSFYETYQQNISIDKVKSPWVHKRTGKEIRTKRNSKREIELQTWLANMYNNRLYAAPAQAVFVTTPVAFIICELKGKIRYNLGMYWSRTINARALFLWSVRELLVAGMTNHMTICIKDQN